MEDEREEEEKEDGEREGQKAVTQSLFHYRPTQWESRGPNVVRECAFSVRKDERDVLPVGAGRLRTRHGWGLVKLFS